MSTPIMSEEQFAALEEFIVALIRAEDRASDIHEAVALNEQRQLCVDWFCFGESPS